ncbi:carbamate kinase [Cedecea colo]|uniref:Carbamate kinase n=1 Tax=Cedecea colo TaxID=2552946 RepID=A0ABX0VLZ6_9ENTR|nr:carbamate kinase [Cedecea colo]NIY47611.1 carbamate kinase [Cedecea colo]
MKKIVVIALGGNALLQRGEIMSAENQYKNVSLVAEVVAVLSQDYRVVIVHGNGPQVGLLALQNLACDVAPAYPLDVLVAETQGMVGYMIAQRLDQQPCTSPVSTLLTRIEVHADDPAFQSPEKFIGPVYAPEEEAVLREKYGWQLKADGQYLRRVVASPRPQRVLELKGIKALLALEHVVVCAGGGGMPVVREAEGFSGVEAVIDKDLTAARLAVELNAEHLMILTDADAVYQAWGTPQAKALRDVTPEQLRPFAAPDGAMGPKAEAVIKFVEQTGNVAWIGALRDAPEIMAGRKGTRIHL